jgi:lipopolysaccharide biosynthesis regulator YciM
LKFSRNASMKSSGAPSRAVLRASEPAGEILSELRGLLRSRKTCFARSLSKGWDQKQRGINSGAGAPSFAAVKTIVRHDTANGGKGWARRSLMALTFLGFFTIAFALARAAMPEWLQNIEVHSLVETAIFRTVNLPGGPVIIKRPAAETVPALGDLLKQHPQQADLYSLKALEEEQKLDFTAAEADWKLYLQNAADKAAAEISLADFYHRRHRPGDEVAALSVAAHMPSPSSEKLTAASDQSSWQAFQRIFQVIDAQALGKSVAIEQYNAWIARYPQEPSLYGRYFEFLLDEKDFKAAADLIAKYHAKFPADEIFPIRARALLAYKQGSVEEGLAIYEKNFQPLWPPELIKNYFDLLRETRSLRKFLDQQHAALERNPDDLYAAVRIFYYYQQQGNLQAAQQVITDYRLKKDARKAAWSSQELYTFARLLDAVHLYPEAARYYFALYNASGAESQENALAGLANVLLAAPEQPVRFGAADLSMYKDIGTMDTGPGYLNGILSLLLNTTSPASHYSEEEQRAVPYFHRSRAAELVAFFDQRFPNSSARPALHAQLIQAYADYGQDAAVIAAGNDFLKAFPSAADRNKVALLVADAYARTKNTTGEFAIYDNLLQELARKADGVPLGGQSEQRQYRGQPTASGNEGENSEDAGNSTPSPIRGGAGTKQAFALQSANRAQKSVRSPEYQAVLDRYISRLVSLHRLPEALAVWRQELDRNPNDPGLYEKFAGFLEGNQLGTEEEAVYKRAIQQFPDKSWYHKLARWYLSKKRQQDLQALSEQVIRIFSGSELEAYLRDTYGAPQQLELRFNQLAHERFPHNLQFVDNLLSLYRSRQFSNPTEVERLLRNYWFTDPTLRSQFFEYLSRNGRLEAELEALNPAAGHQDWEAQAASNPAAARFFAEAELWRSHFEAAAPAIATVAGQYLADAEVGERASSVYRSLAYFDPRNTRVAVQIETNLLAASPADRKRLARIGDIYSDREEFAKAAPFWNKMPDTEPGRAAAYEEAATVFWDYYFFDDALRLLNLGRRKLHDDALYAYQVGAIYENQGDYPRAVNEYMKGSLAEAASPEAHDRLLQLATRKSAREAVDAATGSAVVKTNYDLGAIQLRVQVLQAQQRRQDLSQFLVSALDHTNSVETLEAIEGVAKEKSLEGVRQHALERQIAASSDPVRRLELRYALVDFYEQKKDMVAAQQEIEALYKENSRTMGVVRSTVDFYWRNKQQQRAIDVLMQAAKDSYPALKTQFSFEAARKMTEVGEYEQARKVLAGLLEASPYNDEYLAAVAETYARAGNNAGLRDFYQDKIKLFQKSSLPADERKDRVAALRRGLIPALTALKDFTGAVDQYIEIINAYPEDAELVAEAANYAQRHQRKDQLLNFYTKTVAASPRDSRWAVVLARVETNNEDFEGAIHTYAQAIKVRPDRIDLVTAKAALEERLLRFDDAAADYATLYELAYHDAHWMEKVAEIRARQGKPEQAVQALKTALIDGRPETPGKYFTMAERLEGWGMLAPAREYAEKGVALAGDDLLADSGNHSGAQVYTRIMTTARQQVAAYQKLETAIAAAQQLPSLAERVAKNGLEGITNSELRTSMLAARGNNARNGMAACMREMGTTAGKYFTPEEKVEFAKFLESKNGSMTRSDAYLYLLPAAEKAGLAPLQAKLMYEQLAARPADISSSALEDLQTRRLKPLEAGQQLEQIALARRSNNAESYLYRAEEMYKLAGSEADELRTLEELRQHHVLQGEHQARYFQLLLDRDPQRLVELAARGQERDAAADFILAHSGARLALSAIEARSGSEPAIWRSAYTALTGLYFKDQSAPVQNAFATVIADDTIGQRLAKIVNRKQALAGDIWFYYGSRYGEYLGITKKGDPEDFLPAEMEHAPLRADGYFHTALYYEETGDLNRAIADYQHVADLNASRIDVHNRLAAIFWKQKHQEQALAEWKRALELLKAQTTTGRTPETFWGDFAATVDSLAGRKLFPQFQPDINEVLRNYVKRNGTYRIAPLLLAVLPHMESPGAAGQLVLELSTNAPEKLAFLRLVLADKKLKLDREPLYRRALELAQDSARTAEGAARQYAEQEFEGLQMEWLQYLLQQKDYDRLRSELAALPKAVWERRPELAGIQLKLAAQAGGLDTVLANYRADAEHAPAADVLRKAATEIEKAGDAQSARKILEFVFSREIENHNLTAPNMLGLAEIRIAQGDVDAAVALLRRMTLVVGNPFENHDAAAALLMRTGHPAQAAGFLNELVKAVPWNAQYRGRLAQAQIAANQSVEAAQKALAQIVSDQYVLYADRVAFADGLHGAVPQTLGSAELNYLAGAGAQGNINPDQPFFFAARIKAAAATNTPATEQVRLLRAALEDTPYGDTARVPLLKAASEAGDFYLALTAMHPYMSGNSYRGGMGLAVEADDADNTVPEPQPEDENNSMPTLPRLSAKDRAEINREIGMALIKTKAPDQALPYLQQAYRLETDSTLKAQLNRELQRIRFTERRQAANQNRQPEVHSELEQPRMVRPKLPEQMASAQKGAAQ